MTRDLRHDLLVYDSDEELVAQLEPYLVAGLDADESVTVVISAAKQAILREALGTDADLIAFSETHEVYVRPEAALASYDLALRAASEPSCPGLRVYGELPLFASEMEWDPWMSYEAIVNRAFEDHGATMMCGYDARVVPEAVIQLALSTHRVVHDGSWHVSAEYEEPAAVVRSLAPTFEPLLELRSLPVGDARALEHRLTHELAKAEVAEARARDMLVAAREVLANAERYGDGVRGLRVGRVGSRFVCEVTDAGPGLDDPLAGYLPPRSLAGSDAGLWIARQLTSRLELQSAPDGLTVRLWV